MRKKGKTRIACLALCLFLTACMSNTNSNNGIVVTTSLEGKTPLVGNIPCEFPLVDEDTSMNILINSYGTVNQRDVFVWKKYEEMTGVNINWKSVSKAERNEAVYNTLMNKGAIDIILRCRIPNNLLTQYGESGYIYNLNKDGMLEKNAPNCWAYLQSHPLALASITSPGGAIYSLPQVNSGAELRVSRKLLLNKKWMDNVNMDVPTTTEELYQLLKAFKEQDANGNGDPNDEIPFSTIDWLSIQDTFYGSFGIGNRGSHNFIVDADINGKARFICATDEYKNTLIYLNKLYSERLLDEFTFTMTMEQWLNNAQNDKIGAYANTNLAVMPTNQVDNWIAVDEALQGPDGYKMCSSIRADFHSVGAAVIPTACTNPELALHWLDYFWTDEGTLFYHMGIEGETFDANDDGTYSYKPEILAQLSDTTKSFDDVIAQYSPYPGGCNPTVEVAPYFGGGETADVPATAARGLMAYGPEEYWPSFNFSPEENDLLNSYITDLDKYTSESRVAFITGEKSFDEWDSYVEQVNTLGAPEVVKVYQAAIDRFYESKE